MTTTSGALFTAPPPQVEPQHLVGMDPAGGDIVVFEIVNGRARIISDDRS